MSFADQPRPDITGKCPPDTKLCGNPQLSSPSQLTCVPSKPKEVPERFHNYPDLYEEKKLEYDLEVQCPINSLTVGRGGGGD